MRVSVVIVNWNRLEDLKSTLDLLLGLKLPESEVIVVDNGSTDGSLAWLRNQDDVKLVEAEENVGAAKGRNLGVKVARGEYLLFLDSDAEIRDASALQKLLIRMESQPTVGAIGLKIMNYYSEEIDQWIYAQDEKSHHEKEFETYSFSACGALVRTDAFRKIGGFADEIFIYGEEEDLSLRLMQADYSIHYSPEVKVYHRESPEGRVPSAFFFTLRSRNWMRFYFRYFPGSLCWRKVLFYSVLCIVKGAINGQFLAASKGVLEGWVDLRRQRAYPEKVSWALAKRWQKLNNRKWLRVEC